ncbi:hypothetical protein MSG28_013349, partial [Choristoneura fumiferana]
MRAKAGDLLKVLNRRAAALEPRRAEDHHGKNIHKARLSVAVWRIVGAAAAPPIVPQPRTLRQAPANVLHGSFGFGSVESL